MLVSNCCHARTLKATSAAGWWFDGALAYEWHECTNCKRKCDLINQGEEEDDQGKE